MFLNLWIYIVRIFGSVKIVALQDSFLWQILIQFLSCVHLLFGCPQLKLMFEKTSVGLLLQAWVFPMLIPLGY